MVFWLMGGILLVLAIPCRDMWGRTGCRGHLVGLPLDGGGLVWVLCLIVEEGCMLGGNGYWQFFRGIEEFAEIIGNRLRAGVFCLVYLSRDWRVNSWG
jgi:hypothetical protein